MARNKLAYALEKYRGVIVVASVPIGLLIIIFMLLPSMSSPRSAATVAVGTVPAAAQHSGGGTSYRYAVVLDAGSTGSRVHVFKFEEGGRAGGLTLLSDTFEQLKPGLSSFADSPQEAADSLKPLLATAVSTVPKELQARTPISLKATAGLRLLPGKKADNILDSVRSLLKTYPFPMADNAVEIMGGQQEGGFAWLTLNYLLGKLGGKPEDTIAAIDLGGGSVQEAFALGSSDTAEAPDGYIMKLKGGGVRYDVYVHSYLGYGLMAGRAKLLEACDRCANGGHPCFGNGYTGKYAYAGADHAIVGIDTDADFGSCARVGLQSLNLAKACGAADRAACSFDGAWRGRVPTGSAPRAYYVSSYFWDRAVEAGIVADAGATSWHATAEDFGKSAADACTQPASALSSKYPSVKEDAAPFFCADLSFCHTLLIHGFKLGPLQQLTLVKQVEYNGQNIEAAWPLGAAINDLSS